MDLSYIHIFVNYLKPSDIKQLRVADKKTFELLLDRFWETHILAIKKIKNISKCTILIRRLRF